jgi:hypothetical protein
MHVPHCRGVISSGGLQPTVSSTVCWPSLSQVFVAPHALKKYKNRDVLFHLRFFPLLKKSFTASASA